MRTTILILCMLSFILCHNAAAQESHETTQKTVSFANANKELAIYNIYGSVMIEGYDGTEAIIEIDQYIKAKSKKSLDQGMEEIKVNIKQDDGAIVVYVEDANTYFDLEKRSHQSYNRGITRKRYKYQYDFTIKVPYDTDVDANVINDGVLIIKDIHTEQIEANNLNGRIEMKNIAGAVNANALNKDIDITYHSNPTEDSYFDALNGDVNITVMNGFKGDVFFKSMNGDFYTSIDDELVQSTTMVDKKRSNEKLKISGSKKKSKNKVKMKLFSRNKYLIRGGGPELHFNLLNGDVNLRETNSVN